MKTVEELLMPRYKVIADYPESPQSNQIGFIYDRNNKDWSSWWFDQLAIYPHLFQRLPWWAERDVEDLPEFIKWDADGITRVAKVTGWDHAISYVHLNNNNWSHLNQYDQPATLAEYETFIKSKKL